MTNFAHNDIVRSLVGMVGALIVGGTFLTFAAGPALAAEKSVSSAQISNIVRGQ